VALRAARAQCPCFGERRLSKTRAGADTLGRPGNHREVLPSDPLVIWACFLRKKPKSWVSWVTRDRGSELGVKTKDVASLSDLQRSLSPIHSKTE